MMHLDMGELKLLGHAADAWIGEGGGGPVAEMKRLRMKIKAAMDDATKREFVIEGNGGVVDARGIEEALKWDDERFMDVEELGL